MGCVSSNQRNRCRNYRGRLSPVIVPRSYSMHVHHPAQHAGDSYHTVALTSSTIGSLNLCDSPSRHIHKQLEHSVSEKKLISGNGFRHGEELEVKEVREKMNFDLQAKLIEAKVWSSMMNEKIPKIVPKTPNATPPGEPETINTWELMEGLEDVSPLRSPNHLRSFSFDVVRVQPCDDDADAFAAPFDRPKSRFHENVKSNSRFDDLDHPEIVSTFRKTLHHPFHIRVPDLKMNPQFCSSDEEEKANPKSKTLEKERVRLYFTSLRVIRKTYEDCCNVRMILKSLRIRIDERDVSMHLGFKEELKKLLEDKFNNGVGITLPRVFLGNKYIGGVEEIKKLNENGRLEKLLEGCERFEDGLKCFGNECEACGDVRFVPCETCSGSCKIYYEEEDDDGEEREYGFQRCPDCNENGLIRCVVCCDL